MPVKVRTVKLGNRAIGGSRPAFIIAEAGINHNGNLGTALQMVDEAARAHADAVKFQVFTPEEVVNPNTYLTPSAEDMSGRPKRLVDLLREGSLKDDEVRKIKNRCTQKEIIFLATPFDLPHVGLLMSLDVVAYKVGSGDVTNIPLLDEIGRTGRPVILSTGMSTLAEIDEAVRVLRARRAPVVLLHCVSVYPAPFEGLRLRTIEALKDRYRVPVGFSDHTLGVEASIAAVTLGASVIEKHFTLDRGQKGPDHAMSIEPSELDQLVQSVRNVELALRGRKIGYGPAEKGIRATARRGIVARKRIRKGRTITEDMLAIRRPCVGLHPHHWDKLVGSRALRDIDANAPIGPDDYRPER